MGRGEMKKKTLAPKRGRDGGRKPVVDRLLLHRKLSDRKPGPGPAAQIFLRPRSLNVLSDPVYTNVLHSIDATAVDTISELCCNAQLAEVTKGEAIERQERRLSLVFVHKLEPDYDDTARGD